MISDRLHSGDDRLLPTQGAQAPSREGGSAAGAAPIRRKVGRILARLDEATVPANLDLPGFRLHALKGDLAGYWSVSVSGNWRIVFRFDGVHADDVDLIDYH